jgi:hypothetical protein
LRVEPKHEQTIFSRSNYQFWFATRRFGNFREVSGTEGESWPIPCKNGLSVRFGSDDSGTPNLRRGRSHRGELHRGSKRTQAPVGFKRSPLAQMRWVGKRLPDFFL